MIHFLLRPRNVKDWTWKVLISSLAAASSASSQEGRHRAAASSILIARRTAFCCCATVSSRVLLQPSGASLRSSATFRMSSSLSSAANADSTESASSSSSPSMPPPSLSPSIRRIAVGQLRCTADKWSNLVNVARCAGEAQRQGACMLFLPENAGFLGSSAAEAVQNAEPPFSVSRRNSAAVAEALKSVVASCAKDGLEVAKTMDIPPCPDPSGIGGVVILDGLQTIARASQLWLTGTIHVGGGPPAPQLGESDSSSSSRVYNTHVVVNSEGELVADYKKIHLFDVNIPGQVTIQESASTAPGNHAVVCDSPIGRLGLSTCYDVRFPELYAALVRKGAQVLLVPSAFTVPTGRAHWHVLLRARAIECQCYVIAAAQVGRHNAKRHSYGHSLVIDPWGTVLVDAGGEDSRRDKDGEGGNNDDGSATNEDDLAPKVVCCDIDMSLVESIREKMPVQLHRSSAQWE